MKIVISGYKFDVKLGFRILKTQYGQYNNCPVKDSILESAWKDLKDLKFKEIALLPNLEQRRIAFTAFGIERLAKNVSPILMNKGEINKEYSYINQDGQLVNGGFTDVYELYRVGGKNFGNDEFGRVASDAYYIKCFCTSTGREYMIWVDMVDVSRINSDKEKPFFPFHSRIIFDAVAAVAWTITTNLPPEAIDKIIRQGDCVMFKVKEDFVGKADELLKEPRHLTKQEYLEKLVAES